MLGINKSMQKIMYYENILEFKEKNGEELNINEINNWKLCRTCLVDTDENDVCMENMSIVDAMHGTILNIREMLVDITSIKISKTGNMPLHVCNTCFSKITELYYFCIQIRKAEQVINRLGEMFTNHIVEPETKKDHEIEVQDYSQGVENISVNENVPVDENETIQNKLPNDEVKKCSEVIEEISDTETELQTIQNEIPKDEVKDCSEVIEEISDTGTELQRSEDVFFNNEAEFLSNESLSDNDTEIRICSSDEESKFENNLIEYLETFDAGNEKHSSNITEDTNERVNIRLKETKLRANKRRAASGTTGYKHKQPRVTSPLLNNFDCAICQNSFDRQQVLVQHVRESHPNSKAFKCRVCGNLFSHIQSLSRHMNSHKQTVILNECKHCSKLFVRVDDLKRHVRVHTGERPYVCSICAKSFQQQSDLKYHLKKHDYEDRNLQPRIYECNQCEKGYTSRTGLNWHKKKHHKQERGNQILIHQCSVYDELSSTVSDLKQHSARHDSESLSVKESEKENEEFTIIDDED